MKRDVFLKVVAEFGGELDLESERTSDTLVVDAPKGKRWVDGCHCIVEPFANSGGQSWKPEAYAAAAQRIKFGTEDCFATDCDVCETR